MAKKSADAFRTISEVAEWLDTPAHVLRFWESKFSQVKPVKRAGGRRYYRPSDMQLLGGIKKLLHDDGMTIKGAQKLLRENGIRYVAALSQPLEDELEQLVSPRKPERPPLPHQRPQDDEANYVDVDVEPAMGEVLPFAAKTDAPENAVVGATETGPEPETPEREPAPVHTETSAAEANEAEESSTGALPSFLSKAPPAMDDDAAGADAEPVEAEAEADAPPVMAESDVTSVPEVEVTDDASVVGEDDAKDVDQLPAFLRQPLTPPTPEPPVAAQDETAPTMALDDIVDPDPDSIDAPAGLLSRVHPGAVDPALASEIRPLLAQLTSLRDRMAAHRRQ